MGGRKGRPYRVVGAYDSETSNIQTGAIKRAFPVLHQLGMLEDGISLSDVMPENVEELVHVSMYRHTFELYSALDRMAEEAAGFVPVVVCHNLSFDMYPLAPWLNSHEVRVLAKSPRKPITFTVIDEHGDPALVLWDTLVFSQKPLSMMGHECGYEKLSGDWDYSLVRTPETELSEREEAYAKHDVYALMAWLGYWCRMNPDIPEEYLGLRVVTKTGVIRMRRIQRFDGLKGQGRKYNVGRFWNYLNRREMPKSDDELYTLHAATRGGFTFCASRWASVPITGGKLHVLGYDATSQHPAQMVSKAYPVRFEEASAENLELAFSIVRKKTVEKLLANLYKPFPVAFYACFEFENIRPKAGTLFEREGIFPLASARFSKRADENEDNGASDLFNDSMFEAGYKDTARNPRFLFGKLVSADSCRLWITELAAWEVCQCYDFDSVRAVSGYISTRFEKASDMAVISVMQFYEAKNAFKGAMREYRSGRISQGTSARLQALGIPAAICGDMERGVLPSDDLNFVYVGLKADLNGLFGIEATNEYRRDTVITDQGIGYSGEDGLANAPKNPKAWYQFGQRIVGWSRIAQNIVMQLCYPFCEGMANGDTDSVKMVVSSDTAIDSIDNALAEYSRAVDRAKRKACRRVETGYPEVFSSLDGIGHYVLEFDAEDFCCAWNKAYCIVEGGRFDFTLAGVPTASSRRETDMNRIADSMLASGMTFPQVCDELLGYNLTISNTVTGLNERIFPQWGSVMFERVVDWRGKPANVSEPYALALFPMSKTLNNTDIADNFSNMKVAVSNNPGVKTNVRMLYVKNGKYEVMELQRP